MTDTLTTIHKESNAPGVVEIVTAFSAITATNTPASIPCVGAKKIAILFTEGGTVNNRSGALVVTASVDDTTYATYNMLIDNVANTNSQTLTRVASKTRASAGSDLLWLTPETLGPITSLKLTCTITDGGSPTGNFTAKVVIYY